jgi:DNA-binding MarR family transcriptional regulator
VPSAIDPAGDAAIVGDDSAPAAVGLRYLVLAQRVRKTLDRHMLASGLSLARWKVLEVLEGHGSIRQKSLAEELGLAQRSVTQAVEGLASDGLVERTADPADGRAKLVTLTDEGAVLLAASTAVGEQVLRRIFGSLDHQQLVYLDGLLGAIDSATGKA